MKGCTGPRSTVYGVRLIESVPLHGGEVSRRQMLGTTKCGIVPARSTRGASGSLDGQQGRKGSRAQKPIHPRIPLNLGLPFVRRTAGPSNPSRDHRSCRSSESEREENREGE